MHVYTKLAMGLFVCGLFIKGGLVPFHGWVLGAYSAAPAATSVLLAGIATKISGIYTLIRLIVSVFGFDPGINQILLIVGAVSAVVGALAALGQTDFKRLLAYSSISQMGYILLGLGCGSELGLLGAVFHFFNHAMFKSQLFVNSAALQEQVGTTDMNKMGGLGSRMPWTSTTSILAALSTAGVPPLSGFWSKLIIIIALWQAGMMGYSMLAVAVSVLTLAYMLMMQQKVFFGRLNESLQTVREARASLVAPAVILAAITIGVGVAVPLVAFVLNLFQKISTGVFPHI
jgi:multicomponent Na+:H+ antiporter subunit D